MANEFDLSPDELAALLSARLCHDLVSPVVAIGTALDVLDDDDAADMRDEALDLVRKGARQASAKLEFARLAFGAGGSSPGVIAVNDLKRLAGAMFEGAKSDLHWKLDMEGLTKPAARLVLNLCILAVESTPRGGEVTIEGAGDALGGMRLRVLAQGPRARLLPAAEAALEGRPPEHGYDGRSIQPYYAGLIARTAGGRVSASLAEERVEFTALLPGEEAAPRAAAG